MIEIIQSGRPSTPFMAVGDRIRIEADVAGRSPFGAIDQRVVAAGARSAAAANAAHGVQGVQGASP
jgi:fumarylacetoacetate (FAA) hydrolase